MIQAVMTSPGVIDFHDAPKPQLMAGQVLIKIIRIGVCGSDIHVYHGKHPYTSYPVVQGHEVSGRIIEISPDVTSYQVGDAVTIQPQVVCGECYACRHGRYNICDSLKVMGFQTTGTASEFFAVDAAKLVRLPEGMSFDEGAMIEPLAVAVHALHRGGEIAGKKILVLGAGPIGNLVAQAAKGMGAKTVMITDLSAFRLSKAAECSIDYPINTGETPIGKAIAEHFGPDKADLILECVGVNATMAQAIDNARKGTDIIVVGVFGEKAVVDLGLVQDRELRLIGTLMYREEDYLEAIKLVNEGRIKLKPLISNHFAFKDYLKAYQYIEEAGDQALKVMIDIAEE